VELADDDDLWGMSPAPDSSSEVAVDSSSVQLQQEPEESAGQISLLGSWYCRSACQEDQGWLHHPLLAVGGAAVELGGAEEVYSDRSSPCSLVVSTVVMHGSDLFQVVGAQSNSSASQGQQQQQHCAVADGWFDEGLEQDWLLHRQLSVPALIGSRMLM